MGERPMKYTSIVYKKRDHIAYITLNSPEADNVLNQRMEQELVEICQLINQDDSIFVVVMKADGDGAFCAGSEFEKLVQAGQSEIMPSEGIDNRPPGSAAAEAIADINHPVIAVINGDALGIGLELALSCDIRLASEKARFGLPQVAFGLMPMAGGTQRLPRIVGKGKALEMILTGEIIDADTALEIGLVNKVIDSTGLNDESEAVAGRIASMAPIALRYVKEAVNTGLGLTLEQGMGLESDLLYILHTTADRIEGINAFRQRRKPEFKGE